MSKENDIYYGNLMLLKQRVNAWATSHPLHLISVVAKFGTAIIGFAAMFYVYYKDPVEAAKQSITPFTLTILIAFLAMIFVARKVNSILQPPFAKLYNARFEASDDGIYCFYQQKMAEFHYYIKDKNIKEWTIDRKTNCMYIKGKADLSKVTREGEENVGPIDALYMLIPFDEFDLDDLIAPYGDLVQFKDNTMREQYTSENATTPYILSVNPYAKKN